MPDNNTEDENLSQLLAKWSGEEVSINGFYFLQSLHLKVLYCLFTHMSNALLVLPLVQCILDNMVEDGDKRLAEKSTTVTHKS